MSILLAVKRLLTGPAFQPVSPPVALLTTTITDAPAFGQTDAWATTLGALGHHEQERHVTYHNNEITGYCTGQIAELTGSAMIGLFEDLPTWLPSFSLCISIETAGLGLRVSMRATNGTPVYATMPGTFETDAEIVNGRVWLKCEATQTIIHGIQYKAVIT